MSVAGDKNTKRKPTAERGKNREAYCSRRRWGARGEQMIDDIAQLPTSDKKQQTKTTNTNERTIERKSHRYTNVVICASIGKR
jgi:hypothetical protein